MRRQFIALALFSPMIMGAAPANDELTLEGSWTMESAYEILANGTRVTNYGEHPNGLMLVDRDGRYSIQIFRPDRPKFQSGDKTRGDPAEYRAAVLGSSTHFGRVKVDPLKQQLVFEVDAASFPNWEGKRQVRNYSYAAGILTYAVPASASGNGTIAWSVWRKIPDPR
ncbi:MAG: lipocalin-like domain-containing protein [Sphingomicrobium sp.]